MKVLSFGEILWDLYPSEKYIGGAPLNFAAHLAKQGGESYILSTVGNDDLGSLAVDSLTDLGVKTDYISISDNNETGKCIVTLDAKGIPTYNLLDDVAYDYIPNPDLSEKSFDAFYFGSLALRNSNNRDTVTEILRNNSFKEIFVDVNIRKPFVSKEAITVGFENATIIKISDEELSIVTNMLFNAEYDYINASKIIAEKFNNIKLVIITLGEKGSFAYNCKNNISYFCGAEEVKVVSTVGAGDSFSATFLNEYLNGFSIDHCLKLASKVSAFVVSKAEAIPDYTAFIY